MKHKIGTVTISYNDKGKAIANQFEPAPLTNATIGNNLGDAIVGLESTSIASITKEHADIVLSKYFSQMTDVELNRKITSEQVKCDRWPNQIIKECAITYYYE